MELSAIVKVFRLMEELGSRESPAQLSVLARASGIPKATAHRVLRQLCDIGYVEREEGGTYRLTSKIQQLSAPPVARQLLVAAESHLEELHRQLGETVNLAVLRDGGVVYLRVYRDNAVFATSGRGQLHRPVSLHRVRQGNRFASAARNN